MVEFVSESNWDLQIGPSRVGKFCNVKVDSSKYSRQEGADFIHPFIKSFVKYLWSVYHSLCLPRDTMEGEVATQRKRYLTFLT